MKKTLLLFVLILAIMVMPFAALAQDSDSEGEEGPVIPEMGFWDECPAPENLPETVTIGAIFGQTGRIAVYGVGQTQAVELAVQHINESGYLGEGTTLEVIFEDSAGDIDQAIAAMTKLVEQDEVLAVIGPTLSTEAFSADPIAQENGTPVLGVSNTANGITDMGEFVFRDSLPEASVIPGTIAQAKEILGLERVGVLYGNDDDFTVSGYNVFIDALNENDIEIVGEETFAVGDVDFSAQLTNLLDKDPDALVVSALAAEGIEIILQARDFGFDGPIIGGNGFNTPAIAQEAGEAAEGVMIGAAWHIDNPSEISQTFTQAYMDAYDAAPNQFDAQAYTGAWLIATAIRCADSTDRSEIRDALASIEDFDSPLGLFSFDENRNPVHDPIVQVIEDGSYKILEAESEE
ncbi:MAG: ABC transporter substrate-binding protein [Chloroflexi bacterium]|nr:MAG: ABC transporter substrate-binding protein [Chloroflexota bacterium]